MPTTRKPNQKLTPARIAELSKLARKIDRDEAPDIKSKARAAFSRHQTMQKLIADLKAARQSQGLSLTEVGEKSGIGKANLSRLENDPAPNPTWDTIARYAQSLGRTLDITVR